MELNSRKEALPFVVYRGAEGAQEAFSCGFEQHRNNLAESCAACGRARLKIL